MFPVIKDFKFLTSLLDYVHIIDKDLCRFLFLFMTRFVNSLCLMFFPGCIAASQRNDNVYVSGFSNGEFMVTQLSSQ